MNHELFLDLPLTRLLFIKHLETLRILRRDLIFNIRHARSLAKTKKLKKSQTGPALVVANGTRLKEGLNAGYEKYPELEDAKVMCINHFILHQKLVNLRPDYYLLLDPLYFNQDFSDENIEKWAELSHTSIEDCKNDMILSAKVRDLVFNDLSMKLFVPQAHCKNFSRKGLYAISGSTSTASRNFTNITKTLGWRTMSAYVALSIVKYLGHNPIYVAGFDNDSWRSIKLDPITKWTAYEFRHFYPEGDLAMRLTDAKPHQFLASAASIHRLQKQMTVINLDPNGLF